MSIGENIKNKRLNLGLTQKGLGDKVGVSESMINQIERGTKVPTLPLGKQIADVLLCEIGELLG